jgi:translation elongation factor EF-Tu-like GTPase
MVDDEELLELVEMETKAEIFKKLDEYLEFLNNRPPKPSYSPAETDTDSQ